MTFRFVHTADLHLDSPLVAMALRDPDLAREIGVATRSALAAIVDLCLAERVDALLISGDLWDGSQASAKTPGFLKQELQRLDEGGIRCFIIRGNHDAVSKVTRELDPPPNTTVFGAKPSTVRFEVEGHSIAVHGLSFAEASAPGSLLPLYPAPEPGAFNIGMMHTSLNGSAAHDVYAPCALADMDAHGYDYWALGHIHRRAEYRDRALVVMPGIPQGRDIGEAGACSVTLATLDETGLRAETRSVASLRFERLDVALEGIADWSELIAKLDGALRAAAAPARPEPHLVIRPRLVGRTPLAWRIARDLNQLADEAGVIASSLPGIWIDKLENATSGEDPGGDLPDDLARLITSELPQDPAMRAAIIAAAHELQRDLPPELNDLLGLDQPAFEAECDALLAEGSRQVLARLTLGEGE